MVPTPEGQMPAFLCSPAGPGRKPAVLLLMEAFGLTQHIQDIAIRMANEGYVVLAPDLYYRDLPQNKFGYDEVEQAMAMMYRLDFGKLMEEDLGAALATLRSRADVYPDRVGVTGFCLGGGLTFFAACKFSGQITTAAPFYGMVLDEWVEAVANITVPVHLFFGEADPYIPQKRVRQVEARFRELGKEYTLKVYPDADHGFFCHERASYNRAAAEDSWRQLTAFFGQHLQRSI
jgi:carboxymethylenebutenolidase